MNQPKRGPRQNTPSLDATRERLALVVISLFAIIILVMVFVPNAAVIDKVLSFVSWGVAMVIVYYFQRRS